MDNKEIKDDLLTLLDDGKPPGVVISCFEYDQMEMNDHSVSMIAIYVHTEF